MLSSDEIQQSLAGAWRLMFGKSDGLRLLDISIDGFWNSFQAILLASPPLIFTWIDFANRRVAEGLSESRSGVILASALVDLGGWVLPLIALALVARRVGIADSLVAYIVSSNWASAIICWMMLPIALLRPLLPGSELPDVLLLVFFVATSVMTWRLTNSAIGKGPALATGVFSAMLVGSILTVFSLSSLFGLSAAAPQ